MSDKTKYNFGLEKKRYLTKGIATSMPDEYILLMWQWIDLLVQEKGKDVDYLQVFEYEIAEENGRNYQQVTHSQEEPFYKEVYRLEVTEACVTGKVFVTDDSEQCVMMWAEEW